jgi:hypothetical protein
MAGSGERRMGMMGDLIASGRVVDAILVLMVIEACALWFWRKRVGRGPSLVALLPNFAAGACLLMALRAAVTNSGTGLIAGWLFGALVAHLADLASRWR